MAVTISGTDGISGDLPTIQVSNGTASAPALTGQDTDTGVSFGTNQVNISTDGTQRVTVDSSGRLLVGLTANQSLGTDSYLAQIKTSGASAGLGITRTADSVAPPFFSLAKSRNDGIVQDNDFLGKIQFIAHDGNDYNNVSALIQAEVDGTPGSDDVPGALSFHTTADGASSPTERMRISSAGAVSVGTDNNSPAFNDVVGIAMDGPNGVLSSCRNTNVTASFGRKGNDGGIVEFFQAGSVEGNISVSGSTVSYNGAHLARWSQLADGAERTEILRGSVLSNLDEMCEWAYEARDAVLYTEEDLLPEGVSVGDIKTPARDAGTEDNEQLNRMKVSDVEGDVNVAGVFQAWDDDDDTYTNDFYCAMTGDFVIRIAQGTTVARGDLLMSAGDGTAKPQDDDIVRSKTIAKVTSTTVSTTYSDGSYCVPCVLMAC